MTPSWDLVAAFGVGLTAACVGGVLGIRRAMADFERKLYGEKTASELIKKTLEKNADKAVETLQKNNDLLRQLEHLVPPDELTTHYIICGVRLVWLRYSASTGYWMDWSEISHCWRGCSREMPKGAIALGAHE